LKTKQVSGVARRAYGKEFDELQYAEGFTPLPKGTEVSFSGPANLFTTIEEVRNAGKYPDDSKIVDYVNRDVVNTARNKAQNAAFDAAGIIKPTINNDADKRLADMVKLLKAAGQSEEEATTTARIMLKMDAPDAE